MKKRFTCSLAPLQNRIKEELPEEKTPFFKAFSIIYPIIIYYAVSQLVILLFAYFMQWVSLQEGSLLQLADWLREYSVLVSGMVKGLSLIIGEAAVFSLLIKEAPVITMPPAQKRDIGILFFLGAGAALAVNILFALLQFTGSSEGYEQVAAQQFSFPLWAGIILYGIISPLAEEIVFRGIVYNRMRRQYSLWTSLIGSSVLFGLYHGNLVQIVYGSLLGLLIALMYEKYGSFLVPVILHGAANISVYAVTSNEQLQRLFMNWSAFLVSLAAFMVLLTMCLSKEKLMQSHDLERSRK